VSTGRPVSDVIDAVSVVVSETVLVVLVVVVVVATGGWVQERSRASAAYATEPQWLGFFCFK
jgi:hypothetical protein